LDVINQSLVDDPTALPPGFNLPRHLWANLTISELVRDNVLQILLVGARYQTHLVVVVLQNRQ